MRRREPSIDVSLRLPATALMGALLVSCSPDAGAPPRAQIADRAGTRVVTYDLTETTAPTFRVVGDADLEIGARSGSPAYTFSRIADLAVMGDGSVLVSDAQARELRVFAHDGTYLRTLGGPGDGPGEFGAAPAIAGASGDTVFVFDPAHLRLTAFTLGGDRVDELTLGSSGSGPSAVLRQRDGTYLARYPWGGAGGSDATPHDVRLELDSIALLRLDAGGRTLDTVRVMADRVRLRVVQAREGGRVAVQQTVTPWATQAVVRSDGVAPVVARSDSVSFARLDENGGVPLVVGVRGFRNPATAEDIRSFQEDALAKAFGDQPVDPMVRRINLDYLPERLPAFANLLVSSAGDVWVARSEFDASGGYDWLVFAQDGQLRGRVHTPPMFRLAAVVDDHLFGVYSDDLDVQYVRALPLRPPTSAP